MSRRLDLDQAIADRKPLTLVFRGTEYEMPGAIPAKAVLSYLPVITEEGGIPQELLGEFFSDLIGKDTYYELLDAGLSFPELNEVVGWVVKEYGLVPAEPEGDGSATEVAPSQTPT